MDVVNGKVVTLEPREPELGPEDYDWLHLTVEDIFSDIAQTITNGDVLEATHDLELGHPVTAELDPEPSAVDDEATYRITELTPTS